MVGSEKRTEQIKLMLTERELLDASRLAAIEDRTLAEFIRLTLRVSMYELKPSYFRQAVKNVEAAAAGYRFEKRNDEMLLDVEEIEAA